MSGCGGSISPTGSGTDHSCLNCGACCAAFRVSFYWAEAEVRGLPVSLTEKLNPWMSCMAGTNAAAPHCVALSGKIGQRVACAVYPQRPSPCREVAPGDDQCRRARRVYGLPPLA